jgi:hypothetical protein
MKQNNIKSAVSGAAPNRNTHKRRTDGSAFFTPAQLANRWAWHDESVRRFVRRGSVEAVILGGRVLIPIAEIERIENEGRVARAA